MDHSLTTSCRILTLSSELDRALVFVQQVQTLSGLDDGLQNNDHNTNQPDGDDTKTLDEKVIPWTISNKYYSAQVHFLARTVKGLAPFHLKDVPAIVFVWEKGHAYKHHIKRICRDRDLNGSEPEVSLAVRIDSSHFGASEDYSELPEEGDEEENEEEFEDSGEIDEYLSSKGFEFIDIPASAIQEEYDVLAASIPSLPRVQDALSTIMWPSMQASTKRQTRIQRRGLDQTSHSEGDGDNGLLDWAQNSFDQGDTIDLDFDNDTKLVTSQTPVSRIVHQARMMNEMEELQRWLEEEEGFRDQSSEIDAHDVDDPWRRAASSTTGIMTTSPTSEEGGLLHSGPGKKDKFDDDFTVFVSAPAENSSTPSGPSHTQSSSRTTLHTDTLSEEAFPNFASFGDSSFTAVHPFDDESLGFGPNGDTSFDSLAPSDQHSGVMYHSLGSASDLGEMLDDQALPTPLSKPNEDKEDQISEDDSDEGLPSQTEIRATAQRIFGPLPSSSSSLPNLESLDVEEGHTEFDDDMDFDLTHMVSAIQGMKAEISGIENMDERKKAAARVALGLVYGLDRRG
ncbi:hypothetical protein EV361DRAFT_867224 [Lentinula raphanica]|uniref:Uncharacterized protein n=1 Tax=Lentinula raphanica TaxID=153919 RepID=A0AA38P9R6_9AGAR|nr:hypothetical protein F5880DRAFT_5120 [Lentinula raphanica]KAJ3838939.1 hypothetical protein F5878DRAFT_618006 [Lentinula raphanica]KAJ3973021.1 hypothetical protein EV361DRAFT_867224 [Lentinula raphanica]